MSHLQNIKKLFRSEQNPYPLYVGTFFFSGAHGGVFTVALPFVIMLLGGSDKDLGNCFGVGTMAYLLSCIVAGRFLDNFSPKRALQVSSAVVTVTVACIFLVIQLFMKGQLTFNPIILVTVLNALICLALALFWPPMMGWLSTGHEGAALSRRLSIFNTCWSFALVVSPILGGYLAQVNTSYAILLSTGMIAVAFISVTAAASPAKANNGRHNSSELPKESVAVHSANQVFCWMSRIGLITSCIAVGLMRTQVAFLFKWNLGFSEFQFGILTMFLCLACFAIFYITGKTDRWHHKTLPLFASQVIIIFSMVLVLYSSTTVLFYLAAAMTGLGQGFIYSSHQYYGVSGSTKRSGNMAIHEIAIAIGYGTGAVAGGYLAENFTRYAPYKFALAVLIAGIVIQLYMLRMPHRK